MPKPIAEDYKAIALARRDIAVDEAVGAVQLQMEAEFLKVLGKQVEPLRYDDCGINRVFDLLAQLFNSVMPSSG
jgi:hypothetical protein